MVTIETVCAKVHHETQIKQPQILETGHDFPFAPNCDHFPHPVTSLTNNPGSRHTELLAGDIRSALCWFHSAHCSVHFNESPFCLEHVLIDAELTNKLSSPCIHILFELSH